LKSQISGYNNIYGSVAPSILHLFNHVYSINDEQTLGVSDDRDFAISFQNNKVSWNITSEKKLILGFIVFKAIPIYETQVANRTAHNIEEVWFCPSLNKKGGPVLYNNLPGLILEVLHRNSLITAKSIEEFIWDGKISLTQKRTIDEDRYHENAKKVNEAIRARSKN
jgi:GLPGLI family protein